MFLLIILTLVIYSSPQQTISISLNNIIHLPKGAYTQMSIEHQMDKIDETVFESETILKLEPRDRFSNEKFDVFRNSSGIIDCYLTNLEQIEYLYSRKQSCSTNCVMDTHESFTNSYQEVLESQSDTKVNLIIDNTLSPCHNGAFYPQVDLYQQLITRVQPDMSYFYLYKGLVLILVLFLMISGIVNSIMWVKFVNVKKSLNKSLMKTKDRENLDVIYTKIKQQNEVMLSSHQPQMSIRQYSNSEIMMRIN